jgi:hypothetical protein
MEYCITELLSNTTLPVLCINPLLQQSICPFLAAKAPASKPRIWCGTSNLVWRMLVVRGTYVTTARSWSRKLMLRTKQGRDFWTMPKSIIQSSPRKAFCMRLLHGRTWKKSQRRHESSAEKGSCLQVSRWHPKGRRSAASLPTCPAKRGRYNRLDVSPDTFGGTPRPNRTSRLG